MRACFLFPLYLTYLHLKEPMKSKDHTSLLRPRDRLLLLVVPPLLALLIKALTATCRVVRIHGLEQEREALAASASALYATWHQRMMYLARFMRPRRPWILISQSRDGTYGAETAMWLGFGTIRGSSSRGGARALLQVSRQLKDGQAVGILADGPRGPAREAKPGPVLVAAKAGVPLLPVMWGADRCWVLNSWDRYLIPKPFARIAIHIGKPIYVPRPNRREDLEPYRKRFEDEMNKAARWCDEQFGEERPWKRKTEERK
jgi:lysophospholipid acyltransferase (LPLAT)-like uncharacterized protein